MQNSYYYYALVLIFWTAPIMLFATPAFAQFSNQKEISSTVDGAISVFAADLDGDGDQDVLSASREDHTIAWYENLDGLGTFSAQQVISSEAYSANTVAAADLDGDDDLDVLAAYSGDRGFDGNIVWYQNTDGLGSFSLEKEISSTVDGGTNIFARDFDGDGDLDVLSSTYLDGFVTNELYIAWYQNTDGSGAFGEQNTISMRASEFTGWLIYPTDLDGDGDFDVLSATSDSTLEWHENIDGLGTFDTPQTITTQLDLQSFVYAADLDGDGDQDVLSNSRRGDTTVWYENTGVNGAFGDQHIISQLTVNPIQPFTSDLDGDGDLDLLSGSSWDGTIVWYENMDGLGAFREQQEITFKTDQAVSVFAADLDGDGDQDVLSASIRDDKIAWYENLPFSGLTADSLALAAIYLSTDGDNWVNNTNWFTEEPISDWYGVTVTSNRVTGLNLEANQLTGDFPIELIDLSKLQTLDLSKNNLTGSLPATLPDLRELSFLSVFDNRLSDALPQQLGVSFTSPLETLNLGANQFSGTLPELLARLVNLRHLYLNGNQFEGNIPEAYQALQKLEELDVSNNPSMSGVLSLELTNLNLTVFLFSDTELCEDLDPKFQDWLATISSVSKSGCTYDDGMNVSSEPIEFADGYILHVNFPNPFNHSTQLFFETPAGGYAKVVAFDAFGRQISVLLNEVVAPGLQQITWQPQELSSGVYHIQFELNDYVDWMKLVYIK